MCTVTVIPRLVGAEWSCASPAVRLVCNRDEQRSRPIASDPICRALRRGAAVMPIDPTSGGTWIGVNDSGLVACLLNANPSGEHGGAIPRAPRMSRGLIVPELLVAETMAQAWSMASRLDVSMYAPFRLIVMSKSEWIIASSNGCALVLTEPEPLQDAIVLSSSGLGDHLVEDIRRDLFQQLVTGAPDALVAQDRFHRHQWRDKPHLSVLMSRPDARTVSRTAIDMCSDTLRLTHQKLSDQLLAESPGVRLELTLRRVEVHA